MFNIDREELKMEIEGELARLAPQAGRGYRVRALVVHPYCDPIVAWVPTDYAAVYCIVGGPPEAVKLETGVELFRNKHCELLGLTGNCAFYDRNTEQQVGIAAGTFLVMGVDEVLDETIDLNDDALEKYTDLLMEPNRSRCI